MRWWIIPLLLLSPLAFARPGGDSSYNLSVTGAVPCANKTHVFTASGSYTLDTNCNVIAISEWGAGGNGAAGTTTNPGGSGGSGSYCAATGISGTGTYTVTVDTAGGASVTRVTGTNIASNELTANSGGNAATTTAGAAGSTAACTRSGATTFAGLIGNAGNAGGAGGPGGGSGAGIAAIATAGGATTGGSAGASGAGDANAGTAVSSGTSGPAGRNGPGGSGAGAANGGNASSNTGGSGGGGNGSASAAGTAGGNGAGYAQSTDNTGGASNGTVCGQGGAGGGGGGTTGSNKNGGKGGNGGGGGGAGAGGGKATGTGTGGALGSGGAGCVAIVESYVTPPTVSVAPSVATTNSPPHVGDTATLTQGTWTGSPSLADQWYRGDVGTPAGNISATSPYTVLAGDVGHTLQVRETGTNAGGSATSDSTATGTVISGGFVGIGDLASIPTPVVYYSLAHCYNNAYAGNLVAISDSGGVKITLGCASGVVVKISGTWSLATAQSTCVDTTTCVATTIYDQIGTACSGACNLTKTFAAGNAVNYADGSTRCGSSGTFAASGTWCLLTGSGGGGSTPSYVSPALGGAVNQIWSMICVFDNRNPASPGDIFRGTTNGYGVVDDVGSAANFGGYSGGTPQTVSMTEPHMRVGIAQFNGGTSSSVSIDGGTANTASSGTGALASGETLSLFSTGGSGYWYGNFYECSLFKTTSLTGIIASIYSNEKAFWGGGLP